MEYLQKKLYVARKFNMLMTDCMDWITCRFACQEYNRKYVENTYVGKEGNAKKLDFLVEKN